MWTAILLLRLRQMLLSLCLLVPMSGPVSAMSPINIGLTPTFLNERHALIAEWRGFLERRLKQPVKFILRDSYQETLELLQSGQIDVAWLCDCPHVTANPAFSLLATPLFNGRPFYRAYLIVPEADKSTRGLANLKNKVFAYTDPYSNVGFLVPRYQLKQSGIDPDRFFKRTFFTHSQRKSIEAVAVGVADAASVNSYIWETMNAQAPVLTGRTRIVERSEEFGFPPFVAHRSLPKSDFLRLQQALFEMSEDKVGRAVLEKMNLNGFVKPEADNYRRVEAVVRFMHDI